METVKEITNRKVKEEYLIKNGCCLRCGFFIVFSSNINNVCNNCSKLKGGNNGH